NAQHYKNIETETLRGFKCLNRIGSYRADIIHNHNARTFFLKALKSWPGTVLLVRLADQKSVQLAARDRHGGHNWIGSHGQSTNGLRLPALRSDFLQKNLTGQTRALRIERSRATVHVIVTAGSG